MIKNQLKKDFQWMGLATIIQSICYAIQVILMVRYWGGAGFGLAMTALIPYRIFIIAIDALLSGAIVKNEALSEANKNILFSFCLILGVFCTAFCWIIPYISQIFGGESVWRLYSHGALIPLVIALSIPGQAYFQKEFNFKSIGLGEMAGSLISTLIFMVMLLKGADVALILWVLTAQYSIRLLVWSGIKRSHFWRKWNFKLSEIHSFFVFGSWQVGDRIVGAIGTYLDRIIVTLMFGPLVMGWYSACWELIQVPLSRLNPLVQKVIYPHLVQSQNEPIRFFNHYRMAMRLSGAGAYVLLTILFVFPEFWLHLIFGDSLKGQGVLLQILCGVGLLKAIGNPGGMIFLATNKVNWSFWWNILWVALVTLSLIVGNLISSHYLTPALSHIFALVFFSGGFHYLIGRAGRFSYKPILLDFGLLFILVGLIVGGYFIFDFI